MIDVIGSPLLLPFWPHAIFSLKCDCMVGNHGKTFPSNRVQYMNESS